MRTRIKICGIRDELAAHAAAEAGADAIGFMFVESSVRYIEPEEAYAIMTGLPPLVASVGVFADAGVDEFSDVEEACPTIYSQLHGDEDEELVKSCGPDVIKAVRFEPATIARELERWGAVEEVCAILVDGSSGGAGVAFEWEQLVPHLERVSKPLILAGGLTFENVERAVRAVRPYAVDVSSGVERERGVKDAGMIAAFCEAVRRADGG
jgi:phosphoribosylanthranilate isomerase